MKFYKSKRNYYRILLKSNNKSKGSKSNKSIQKKKKNLEKQLAKWN